MGETERHGLGFETRAIHAGQDPDPASGAVIPPISLSTTFAQDAVGDHKGYEYARSGNPTRSALETCLASLEGAAHGFAFASGLSAEDGLLRTLVRPGDRILLGNDAYGGTFRLISKVYGPAGCAWSAVDLGDPAALDATWPDDAVLVWLETPTNPLLTCIDIEAVADVAHRHGGRCVVDNTFATPYLQRPLEHGADAVVHSTTKYLGGHSDVIGGFVALDDDEIAEPLRFIQNAAGAVPAPFDCYLVLRGLKTLAVRMDRHCANARAIVDLLVGHPDGRSRPLPTAARPSGPRRRREADARLRGNGLVHLRWRRDCRARHRASYRAVHAGRVARCSRVTHRAPGSHDSRVSIGLTVAGRRVARPALGGNRVDERPRRRPRAGARLSLIRRSRGACEGH